MEVISKVDIEPIPYASWMMGEFTEKTLGGIVSILTDSEASGRSSHQYQSVFNELSSAASLRGRVLTASQSYHQHPQEPCQGKLRLQCLS